MNRVTFLVHLDKLFVRHLGAPDVPFELVDKAEMKIVEGQAPITAPEGETLKFKWNVEGDTPEETPYGKRWMQVSPMCSDGKNIYAMVMYKKDGIDSARKSIFVEVYELTENVITFVRDIRLLDNKDAENWTGSKKLTSEGGYLDHGNCASNGVQFVWHTEVDYHVFDLKTGKLIKK